MKRLSESHAICDVCLPKRNLQLFTQSKLKKVTELYPPSLKKLVRKDLICYELDNLQFCNNKILIHVEHNFHDTISKALTAKICFSSILEGSFSRTKQKLNFTYQDSLSLFYFPISIFTINSKKVCFILIIELCFEDNFES